MTPWLLLEAMRARMPEEVIEENKSKRARIVLDQMRAEAAADGVPG